MLSNIGITELLLVAIVVLLLFGPSKLPEMGRSLGLMIQEFRNASKGILSDESDTTRASTPKVNSQSTTMERSQLPD